MRLACAAALVAALFLIGACGGDDAGKVVKGEGYEVTVPVGWEDKADRREDVEYEGFTPDVLLVGEEPQVPHREERRSSLDRALDREGEEGEAPRAQRLVEPETPFAEHVHEREPQEPVHPAREGVRVGDRAGENGRLGNTFRHRAILDGGFGVGGRGMPAIRRPFGE